MKTIFYIIACIFFYSCTNNKEQQKERESIETVRVSNTTMTEVQINDVENHGIDIKKFKAGCDSLVKTLKDDRYFFEIKSDTFNFRTDNAESFTKGHGIFWQLYRDSSERIVRHYLFEPKTKKKLRVYLVEAEYNKKKQLDKVLYDLETSMNDSLNAPDSEFYTKWRLSPVNDYIIASEKKLYWLNVSYPYSNKEFLKFVDCLKRNVNNSDYKGQIICLFGKDCETENVP